MSDKPNIRFSCPMNPILLSDPPQKLSDTPPVTLPMLKRLKRVNKPRFTHIRLHNVSDALTRIIQSLNYTSLPSLHQRLNASTGKMRQQEQVNALHCGIFLLFF